MSDCEMVMGYGGISLKKLELFYRMCREMDIAGNPGYYRNHMLLDGLTVGQVLAIFNGNINLRDGIVYYSRGHGWRLRKVPHWHDVFVERFPCVDISEAQS